MGNKVEARAQRVRNHLQRPDHPDRQLTNAKVRSTVNQTAPRMLLAWMVGGMSLAPMVFAPSFWYLLPLMAVYGFFSTIGNVYWFTLIQTRVPDEVRGRVISVDWLGSLSLVPASAALAGASASPGYATTLFVLGGTLLMVCTIVLLARVRLPQDSATATAPHAENTAEASPGRHS
jgi:hypothetical protein